MIIHDSFADFVVFLYVHVSQADNNYDPAELAAIKSKMKALYPAGTDIEKKLYGALREYNNLDKAKLPALLANSVQRFASETSADPQSVLEAMTDIVRADGRVEPSETNALETLKNLLGKQR